MSALDLLYQYRTRAGKCESGAGLDFDEIDALTAIEAVFAPDDGEPRTAGRRFRRQPVDLVGMLRGDDLYDKVLVTELAPGGLVVRQAPYVDEGMMIEIVLDRPSMDLSYRFKARVQWLREDIDDDFALGLELVGMPVLLHYGPPSAHADELEQAAA
jgi:hypothetical protein